MIYTSGTFTGTFTGTFICPGHMPRAYAPRKSSCYAYYTYYTYYINYTYYTNYTHYFQVRQDLGLADHLWQDKRTMIAQSVDNLGDQFRPAMRAGWLSYIRSAYPENAAIDICPVVGDAIGLLSALNSNPNCLTFCSGIMQIIENIIAIIVI